MTGATMPTHDPHPPARRSRAARIAVLAGGTIALVAAGVMLAGGALLWGDAQKDDQGYFATGSDRFATQTAALATENLDVNLDAPGWLVGADRLGKVRLEVDSRADKPVFVGIAPTHEVERYLRDTAHATVTDVSYSPFRADYRTLGGERRATRPAVQPIWAASAQGSGTQTLTWDVEHGSWSVVVMNADASAGVDVGVSAGANVPVLSTLAWGALGGGSILLAAAGALVFVGVRRPRTGHDPLALAPAAA
jgi:hypothetical protein